MASSQALCGKRPGVDPQKEQCFFDHWDPDAIKGIVDQQVRLTEYSKKRGLKQLFGICIIIDDFADDPRIVHSQRGAAAGGSMLNTLFIRGRHSQISCIVSTQKLRLISSTMRVNTQFLCVWRLRSALARELTGGGLGSARQEDAARHVRALHRQALWVLVHKFDAPPGRDVLRGLPLANRGQGKG